MKNEFYLRRKIIIFFVINILILFKLLDGFDAINWINKLFI